MTFSMSVRLPRFGSAGRRQGEHGKRRMAFFRALQHLALTQHDDMLPCQTMTTSTRAL
jgi:hypothetical protein